MAIQKRGIFQYFKILLFSAVLFVFLPYFFAEFYIFPNSKPFTGKYWINPYQHINKAFIKANFHAHSRMVAGIFNGQNSINSIEDKYKNSGFKIACISNYMHISEVNEKGVTPITDYEHGVNIRKTHQLVIGGKSVDYFDFPFWQTTSQKQQIINQLAESNGFIALAHPHYYGSYSCENLKYLTGYNSMEVLSNNSNSETEWDAALNAGKLAWVMANDDTHDIKKEGTCKNFNQIFVDYHKPKEVIAALKCGKNAAVRLYNNKFNIKINFIEVKNDTLFYDFDGDVEKLKITEDGMLSKILPSHNGQIPLRNIKHFIRLEAQNTNGRLLTNPIFRSNNPTYTIGNYLKPRIDWLKTILFKFLLVGMAFFLFYFTKILKF